MTVTWPIVLILCVLALPFVVVGAVYLFIPVCKGIGSVVGRIVGFVFGIIGDAARLIGALVASVVLGLMCVGTVLIGRWSAAAHYGRALRSEGQTMGGCLYRIAIGRPARLLYLEGLTEGLEKRVPEIVAAAPGADRPHGRAGQFDGYEIIGSLQGGGSGGRLYIAQPTAEKREALARRGMTDVGQVVIKVFTMRDGSQLPQILRENRAIPAAKRLGLILEHEESADRFFYVMRYVPGESLGLVTQQLHAVAGPAGLDDRRLREVLDYTADLLLTLRDYHAGGLWHKDVKPDNIIIAGDGRAHLVDFGLITPLASTMTLTTHGTEYFRDPEMVRLALRGVKVSEVDGAKFDLYAAGAVLFSMIENSFPAHGGLSRITKRCPESVRWIVRRAMTDYDKRYESAEAMIADIEAVLNAGDVSALRPADLPSVRAGSAVEPVTDPAVAEAVAAGLEGGRPGAWVRPAAYATPTPPSIPTSPSVPTPPTFPGRLGGNTPNRPRLKVVNWWTGQYEVEDGGTSSPVVAAGAVRHRAAPVPPGAVPVSRVNRAAAPSPRIGPVGPSTAAEQVRRARARAAAARQRAQDRVGGDHSRYGPGVNAGVVIASLAFVGLVVAGLFAVLFMLRPTVQDGAIAGGGSGPAPAWSLEPGAAGGARILVMRDPVAFDASNREQTERGLAALRTAGFVIAGMDDQVGAESASEAEANLRAAVGVQPFGSTAAAEVIRSWLGEHENVELVVWIGRNDRGEAEPWVISAEDGSEKLARTAAAAVTARAAAGR